MKFNTRYLVIGVLLIVALGLVEGLTKSVAAWMPADPQIAMGEPGTSYRYVETFGVSEVGFEDNATHIGWPYGIGSEGDSVWIPDLYANRAVKFSKGGTYETQIGGDGFQHGADGQTLVYPIDVAADSSGNVWIVDADAHHVLEFDSSGNFIAELGQEWNAGSGNDQFENPRGIAFDSGGNIFVSDVNNHRIQIFDSNLNYLATLGETGVAGSDNSHFDTLRHITIDATDRLFVADAGNYRVQVYDVSSTPVIAYLTTLGVTGVSGSDNDHFAWPQGVAINDQRLYVADNLNHRVQVFNPTTYAYLSTIGGTQGSGDYEFSSPGDVAVDDSYNLYVGDIINFRVQQFNRFGVYVRTYGTTGIPYVTDGYHYNQPTGIAVADNGNIYIVENEGSRLLKLDSSGIPQWTIGTPGLWGDINESFDGPQDVDLDSNERVYVADTWNHRVQIYNSDGAYSGTLGMGYGTGNYEFDGAHGVAVGPADEIYVADIWNHRVQIYDSHLVYQGTLGETGVTGPDNAHFDVPVDVHVDARGTIYVVDRDNQRVQVYNSSLTHILTIGETGVAGDDYGHLDAPQAVTVDSKGRIFIADQWGSRIQVFDSTGAYLTTISTGWGGRRGEMRNTEGLAVDSSDDLFAADYVNHRIQKYALGVPGWLQVNINGFGDKEIWLSSLESYGEYLYSGNWTPQIWRTNNTHDWTDVTPGWGENYGAVFDMHIFNGELYAGVSNENGGEIWRTDGTTWEQVVSGGFDDVNNVGVNAITVYSNTIFAATRNHTTGTEMWSSSTGDFGTWSQVNSDAFGYSETPMDTTLDVFSNTLYVGTGHGDPIVAALWSTTDGIIWHPEFTDGLGNSDNTGVSAMAEFKDDLYIGLRNVATGGEGWRYDSDTMIWSNVFNNGLGNPNNQRPYGLIVHHGWLYVVFVNYEDGTEIWRSSDGTSWELVMEHGWGDSNYMLADYHDKGAVIHNGDLFIATLQEGGKVWKFIQEFVFLPFFTR